MEILRLIIVLTTLNCFYNKAICQNKNEFSISLQVEKVTAHTEVVKYGAKKTSQTDLNYGIGISYERILAKHSSFVIGAKYRQALNDIAIPVATGSNLTNYAHFFIAENFLTLPLLYKYNSSFINFSAGTSVDYFLSWKQQKEKSYPVPLRDYELFFNKRFSFGLLTSISKKIFINNRLILEPSIYYNPILSFNRTYYGFGLETKYKF